MRGHIPEDTKQKIIRLRTKEKLTYNQLGQRFGIPQTTIKGIFDRLKKGKRNGKEKTNKTGTNC